MSVLRPLLMLGAVAATLAAVADAARGRTVPARGPVSALAVGAFDVAYTASTRPGCERLTVWNLADRGSRGYASHCWPATSTGSGVAALAVAGGRALWLTYTGGNLREWSLWTKSAASRLRRIAFEPRDVDGPPPIVIGNAWEDALPYAFDETVIVLGADGARRFSWRAGTRVVALAAHTAGVAAVLESGRVVTLSRSGTVVREHVFAPGEVRVALATGVGLLVQTATALEVRRGASVRRIALPRHARFFGYSDGVAAYGIGGELRLLRLRDEQTVTFRRFGTSFRAQLARRGIGYAYGRSVGFNAWSTVTGAFDD